jgi:hypothetical protein
MAMKRRSGTKGKPIVERMLNVFYLHCSTPAVKAMSRICACKTERNLQIFGWCLQFKQSCPWATLSYFCLQNKAGKINATRRVVLRKELSNSYQKEISTYSDLNPRDSRNQMMCRWSSQITSDCADCLLNPSRPLYLPLPPFSSSPFSYPYPYRRPVCYPAHGHTGVFQNNFLWHKLLALILQSTLFASFLSIASFPYIFRNTPCRKNAQSFSARQWSKKSFLPLLPLLQFFTFLNEPC